MSIITDLTRMWLTRSVQPFTFKNEYDQVLPYSGCENLGLYIHIPFCKSICNFCPYCKVRYEQDLCERYLDTLPYGGRPVSQTKARHQPVFRRRYPDNVNMPTLQILKDAGVTKISIGIQSFQDKFQKLLGRKIVDADFIFALPDQTVADLINDIDTACAREWSITCFEPLTLPRWTAGILRNSLVFR